jgi:dihydrofolate synthase/folylpolyglutamate synthase
MFVTPQLHSVRERTLLNGLPVTEKQFADAMERTVRAVDAVEAAFPALGTLTAFEISTAQTLLIFSDARVDLAIVEVGLGGRLDATNVVEPAVSVITPISFDHEAILGDTLAAIAAEKAGIIKSGVPVIVAPQEHDALAVLRETAIRLGAQLLQAGVDWTTSGLAGRVTFDGLWGTIDDVRLGLRGRHQADNAGTALMALWTWAPHLFHDVANLKAGLASTRWSGRFERIGDNPVVIVDGAHNVASMEVLVRALLDEFGQRRYQVVFGSYRDKDFAGMLQALARLSPQVIATRSRSPRARDPQAIHDAAASLGMWSTVSHSVGSALDAATVQAESNTVVVATGSLSIVAEAREHFGLGAVSSEEREILSG